MEEATFLSKFVSKVTVVYRRGLEQMPASKIMKNRALENDKPSLFSIVKLLPLMGKNLMESAVIRNKLTGEQTLIKASGMFVVICHIPRTELVSEQINLDEQKYIKVHEPNFFTNIEGVFTGDM